MNHGRRASAVGRESASMNWAIFGLWGYVSAALWLCVPAFWLGHAVCRPRRWLCHMALVPAVLALVLARVNSEQHVGRIRAEQAAPADERASGRERARRAAEESRAGEAANIRFAEDASGERLDVGGLDDADRAYFKSLEPQSTPEWKKGKQTRSGDGSDDAGDLRSLIGARQEKAELHAPPTPAEEAAPPILMTEADKALADHLDAANLTACRVMILLALGVIALDYLRRLNVYGEAYFPLPLPGAWADAMTPRPVVTTLPPSPRRTLTEELAWIARRGEVFVLLTDDPATASKAVGDMPRLPAGRWPLPVLAVRGDPTMSDEFVFEALWFGRCGFVVATAERARTMLDSFVGMMAQRRRSRARTDRAVHLVWDLPTPIPQATLRACEELGRVTGVSLIIRPRATP